jgi:hypothetical protein
MDLGRVVWEGGGVESIGGGSELLMCERVDSLYSVHHTSERVVRTKDLQCGIYLRIIDIGTFIPQ